MLETACLKLTQQSVRLFSEKTKDPYRHNKCKFICF